MKEKIVFFKALAVFLGTVIGAGMFALPYVALKSGFFVVIVYFVFMAFVAISINLIYAEIVLNSKKKHRLPGYVGEYFGEKWKKIALFVIGIGLIGTLIAYLIIGGQFLNSILGVYLGGSSILYSILFFIAGSYLIFRGIKAISGIELFLLGVFFVILVIFFIKSFSFIDIGYFKNIDIKFLTLPYGVVLFSLWGATMVPEIKEMLKKSAQDSGQDAIRTKLRQVIFWGILLSSLVYIFFIFIIFGVCGPNTSIESISGLGRVINGNFIKLGFIFGILSCFTSFIALGLTLKKIFWYDFGLSKNISWALACFPPLLLFLLGIRGLISVISFTGTISLGIGGILIIFLYRAFLKKQLSKKMNPVFYALVGIFVLGIIFEIVYFLLK
jgi:amino acid permease